MTIIWRLDAFESNLDNSVLKFSAFSSLNCKSTMSLWFGKLKGVHSADDGVESFGSLVVVSFHVTMLAFKSLYCHALSNEHSTGSIFCRLHEVILAVLYEKPQLRLILYHYLTCILLTHSINILHAKSFGRVALSCFQQEKWQPLRGHKFWFYWSSLNIFHTIHKNAIYVCSRVDI